MKPRNKYEKAVLAESKHLRPITKTQSKWAFRECIDHFAYRLPKGRTMCMDCGHSWTIEKPTDTCTCPHCGARLQVKETFQRKIRQKQYFTILTACGEYQVLRMFLLSVEMEKGCKASSYTFEIGQYWWNAQGRKTIIAVQRTLGRYIDTFSFCSPMAVRNDNEAYRHISYSPIYPKFKVTDTLRRNGFEDNFHNIVPTELIPALLSDSRMETLLKSGQIPLLKFFMHNGRRSIDSYWASIRICLRNGYHIEDGSLWCDMVDMLNQLGKDIHNAKYVCPNDLRAAHDHYQAKRRAMKERENIIKKRKEAMEAEQAYKQLKAKFFGIEFTDGIIRIHILESVQEHLEEGTAMHHCVYDAHYYSKPQSLIFSATKDGERIETIEVSLETMKVVQSRGVCNKNTEYHEQILALMQKNMRMIAQRATA